MASICWWVTLAVLGVATATDLYSRRIPNWLVLPYLVAGLVCSAVFDGWSGLGRSVSGVLLAVVLLGLLCGLRAMGMGDLKLCAAVGAWVGPQQLFFALIVMALAGGVMAIVWAAVRGVLGPAVTGAGELILGFHRRGLAPHPTIVLENPARLKIPYAPAIAVGVFVSFFSSSAMK